MFNKLAAARYSVRNYKDQPVEPEKLEKILEAGRLAPTACNYQPQRIKVINSPEDFAKLDKATPYRFGAPVLLLVCYDKTVCWRRHFDGTLSGEVDASIVTTHMMLAAQNLGLGTCWVMHFDPAKIIELFELPENIVPVAILPIGYPSETSLPSAQHAKRMHIGEFLI